MKKTSKVKARRRRLAKRQKINNNTSRIISSEALEERRLLSVSPHNNHVPTAATLNGPNQQTEQVAQMITKIPAGPNQALAILANWTDREDLQVEIKIDNNGDGTFDLNPVNNEFFSTAGTGQNLSTIATPAGAALPNTIVTPANSANDGEGSYSVGYSCAFPNENPATDVVDCFNTTPPAPPTSELPGADAVHSAVYVHPLGSSPIDRKVMVTLTGSITTDIMASIGTYDNVDQANPVDDGSALSVGNSLIDRGNSFDQPGNLGANDEGDVVDAVADPINGGTDYPVRRYLNTVPNFSMTVAPGNIALDAVHARFVNGPGTNELNPTGNSISAGATQTATQTAIQTGQTGGNFTSSNGRSSGGASSSSDGSFAWTFTDTVSSDGARFFSHAAAQLVMDDGAVDFDFGDADEAAGYDTLLASDGPRHAIEDALQNPLNGPYFGPAVAPLVDQEPDAVQIALAGGDDGDGANDEQGLLDYYNEGAFGEDDDPTPILTQMFVSDPMMTSTAYVELDIQGVSAASPGYVSGWIDWNGDGDFSDANEQFASGVAITDPGENEFTVTIPASMGGAVTDSGETVMRIRIHSDPCDTGEALDPTGHANDGEVEDHEVVVKQGSSLHGTKYEDVNGDGTNDEDVTMEGVVIEVVSYPGLTPVMDLLGNPVDPVETDANGEYWFKYLAPGDYVIRERLDMTDINGDAADIPLVGSGGLDYDDTQGLVQHDPNAPHGNPAWPIEHVVSLGTELASPDLYVGEKIEDLDFLNYIEGSIHGVKFEDSDADGIFDFDDGERGLEGVHFLLYKFIATHKYTFNPYTTNSDLAYTTYKWEPVGIEISNEHGEFWFTGLEPGRYAVRELPFIEDGIQNDPPSGPFENVSPALEGDWMMSTDQPVANLEAGVLGSEFFPEVDANEDWEITSTELFEYIDGILDGEAPDLALSPAEIIAAFDTFLGEDPDATATATLTIESGDELQWDDDTTFTAVPYEGEAYVRPMDLNVPPDGLISDDEITAAAYTQALKNPSAAYDSGPTSLIFGNYEKVDVSGYKYETNLLGGNAPFPGITFELYEDVNGNALLDAGDTLLDDDVTDGAGVFNFDNLIPGKDYIIAEKAITDADGDGFDDTTGLTHDEDIYPFSPLSGQGPFNAGNWINYVSGSIHGVKFEDDNANGTFDFDDGERGLEDVRFELYKFIDTHNWEFTPFTGAAAVSFQTYEWEYITDTLSVDHGEFWFTDLEPGIYSVREDISSLTGDWMQSTSQPMGDPSTTIGGIDANDDGFISLAEMEAAFGLTGAAAIAGLDEDASGTIDQDETSVVLGETPWNDETGSVWIYSGDELQWDAERDPAGDAPFETPPYLGAAYDRPMDNNGDGVINSLDDPQMDVSLKRGSLAYDATPTSATTGLGNQYNSLIYGNFEKAVVTGEKLEILNEDGDTDPFEGIRFVLWKDGGDGVFGGVTSDDTVVEKTVTDSDGNFEFDGIMPGMDYYVTEDTSQPLDPHGNQLTPDNSVYSFTAESGGEYDAGTWENLVYGSIHGVKFEDLDADGEFDFPTEIGLPGVMFELYKYVDSSTYNVNPFTSVEEFTFVTYEWELVAATVSMDHGEFWFTQLEPGRYVVREVLEGLDLDGDGEDDGWMPSTNQPMGNPTSEIPGIDRDGNGIITRAEVEDAFGGSIGELDANGDGTLQPSEVSVLLGEDPADAATLTLTVNGRDELQWDDGPTPFDVDPYEGAAYNRPVDLFDQIELADVDVDFVVGVEEGDGTVTINASDIVLVSSDTGSLNSLDATAVLVGGAPSSMFLSFDWSFLTTDVNGASFDPFGYAVNGVFTPLTDNGGPDSQAGSETVFLNLGDSFEFVQIAIDDQLGEATTTVSNITYATADGVISSAEEDLADESTSLKIGSPAIPELQFGNFRKARIYGEKLEDMDGDGEGDQGFEFVEFDIYEDVNKDGKLDAGDVYLASTDTESDGSFEFDRLKPGYYVVVEPDTQTIDPHDNQLSHDAREFGVKLESGDDVDAGTWVNFVYGSIHGFKFRDFDRDGLWDIGVNYDNESGADNGLNLDGSRDLVEPPLEGIKFDLYKYVGSNTYKYVPFSGNKVTVTTHEWMKVDSQTSDVHGEFWFVDLEPGMTYTIREDLSGTDFEQTTLQDEGNPTSLFDPSSVDADNNGIITQAEVNSAIDTFLGTSPASTETYEMQSGFEFQWDSDTRSTAVLDPTFEFGTFEGPSFTRPMDLNGNGLISQSEIDFANESASLKRPQDADSRLMFGNNYDSGEIHGFKFHDINGDQVWNHFPGTPYIPGNGEPGLGNILIGLVDSTGSVVQLANGQPALTVTMPNGEFWFLDVVPNQDVNIVEFLHSPLSDSNFNAKPDGSEGMYRTTPLQTVSVGTGEAIYWNADNTIDATLVIGNAVEGSIHGFKFEDYNVNGSYEPNAHWPDKPMEWAVFQLLDENGQIVDINGDGDRDDDDVEMTGPDGQFWFTDLKLGTYTVIERMDLIDRNDLVGPGGTNGNPGPPDGLPDGNGVPDTAEGLGATTPTSWTVTIESGEEYAWRPGAAHLVEAETNVVDPDAASDGAVISSLYSNVELEEELADFLAVSFIRDVNAIQPVSFSNASTGNLVFGHDSSVISPFAVDEWMFPTVTGAQSHVFRAYFDVAVKSVSIDVIGNDFSDQGVLIAFDENGVQLDTALSSVVGDGEVTTVTVTAPSGTSIGFIEAGGNQHHNPSSEGIVGSTVGLDNLTYETFSLKKEIVVDESLMFGNYYAGAVHGIKTHAGTDLPVPNIELTLSNSERSYTTTTGPDGHYWFLDVVPGIYSLRETPSSVVLQGFNPFPVQVEYATSHVSESGIGMPYPGLQHELVTPTLAIENQISSSINGIKVQDGTDIPIEGITFELRTTSGDLVLTDVTDEDGEFHFLGILPDTYQVLELDTGQPLIGSLSSFVITVASGEVHVWKSGEAGVLPPGQTEQVNSLLVVQNELLGSIHGQVKNALGVGQGGVPVSLTSGGMILNTSTDAAGNFSFEDLEPGTYDVTPLIDGLIAPGPLSVTVSSGEEETAVAGIDLEVGQYETVNEDLCFQLLPINDPPVVTEVKVGSTSWTTSIHSNNFTGYVDPSEQLGYEIPTGYATVSVPAGVPEQTSQFSALPWRNVNKLFVEFNEAVQPPVGGWASPSVVAIFDSANSPVSISDISYDAANYRLTIQTTNRLGDGRYLLAIDDTVTDIGGAALDGEFQDGVDTLFSNLGTSGDGNPGTKFEFQFNIQHGDASGSGTVDVTDLSRFGNAFGSSAGNVLPTANFNPFADFSGSGNVDVTDLSIFGTNFGDSINSLPAPANPLFLRANASAVDSLFADDEENDDAESLEEKTIEQIASEVRVRRTSRFE